jgi:hypothetical protein
MSKMQVTLIVFVCSTLIGCESRFPLDKRFWEPEDYKKVWYEIAYKTPKGEEFPRFSNPETGDVMRKIVDPQNYTTVLEDSELGLTYRSEISHKYFEHIKDLVKVYYVMDRQDKYIYAQELAELRSFFLGFQIVYFRIGNENIASKTDDNSTIKANERSIIENFNNFLDDLREEKQYGEYSANLADAITTQFPKLIETFPNSNYSGMLSMAKSVHEKAQTPEIKKALADLIVKLEAKQPKPADPA